MGSGDSKRAANWLLPRVVKGSLVRQEAREKLLQQEKYKIIITDALAFLAKENKVQIYAYVINFKIEPFWF